MATKIPTKYADRKLMHYNHIFDVPDNKIQNKSYDIGNQCFTDDRNNVLVAVFQTSEECIAAVAKHNKNVPIVKLLKNKN